MSDTKQGILDAAERLFGEVGYDAASLRAITAAAGVNIAAVNYHFRSKQELLRSVIERRMHPLNLARLAALDSLEVTGIPPTLEQLIRILVSPVMLLGGQKGPASTGFKMLLGRLYSDPSRNVRRLFLQELSEVVRRFSAALRRALPGMPEKELYWRIHFMIGAMAHTLAAASLIEILSEGACDPRDSEGTTERLVAFLLGGLTAPVQRSVGAIRSGSRGRRRTHRTPQNRRKRAGKGV
jgi:AcrR family transcriptional regulator